MHVSNSVIWQASVWAFSSPFLHIQVFLHGCVFRLDMLSPESYLSIYLLCCILMCIQTPPAVGAFGCVRNQVFGTAKHSVLSSGYNDSE